MMTTNTKSQTTTRKAFKNPFVKISQEAAKNNGYLPSDIRKQMMKEAVNELRKAKEKAFPDEYDYE